MNDYGVFINTGRGAQVVEDDLIRALTEKPTRTALLDVTCPEPVPEGHPFYAMDNVFLSPHIAGSNGKELARMGEYMAEEFERYITGSPLRYEITMDMLATMA
jgi:phosphoglycerate dehydrogenase-like enzyme